MALKAAPTRPTAQEILLERTASRGATMMRIWKCFWIVLQIFGIVFIFLIILLVGGYWWANTPPKRPKNVTASGVFLWAGGLGLPAPKHGTWLECWEDTDQHVDKCRLTEMDGTRDYTGIFVPDNKQGVITQSDLKIESIDTANTTFWVRIDQNPMNAAPLVFLESGTVLIPQAGYVEGKEKIDELRKIRAKSDLAKP